MLLLLACATKTPSTESPPEAEAPDAAALYDNLCAACHGVKLEGGVGPSLVDEVWIGGSSLEDIQQATRVGKPAMGMPAYEGILEEDQIRLVAAWILEQGAAE